MEEEKIQLKKILKKVKIKPNYTPEYKGKIRYAFTRAGKTKKA